VQQYAKYYTLEQLQDKASLPLTLNMNKLEQVRQREKKKKKKKLTRRVTVHGGGGVRGGVRHAQGGLVSAARLEAQRPEARKGPLLKMGVFVRARVSH
jgi:hypothetical protein